MQNYMSKLPVFTLLISIFVLFSCSKDTAIEVEEKELLTVTLTEVTSGTVNRYEFAEGTAHALKREFLVFETSGRVAMIKTNDQGLPLREGDIVKGPRKGQSEGDLLAQLDVRGETAEIDAAKAELETARTRLNTAQKELARAEKLRSTGAIGASQFDNLEGEYQLSLSQVNAAQARLQQSIASSRTSEIRAPFDGVIAFINISEGQYVTPSQFNPASAQQAVTTAPIVLIDPSRFEIVVDLPIFQGSKVKTGQQAYLLDGELLADLQLSGENEQTAAKIRDILVPATVTAVSPAVNPGDRAIRARLTTTEPSERLIDGAYMTTWIRTHEKNDVLVLSPRALIRRGEKAYVFVYQPQSQKVKKQYVKLGITGFDGVEILEGLVEGDKVVVDGRYRLTDGMKVHALAEKSLNSVQVNNTTTEQISEHGGNS